MRRLLPVFLLAATVAPVLTAADASAQTPAPVAPAAATTEAPAPAVWPRVALVKNGNVRYGPSRMARVAATLKSGSVVEIVGAARGTPDWLVIRLPVEAKAWMHIKVLTSTDGGKTFTVTEDRAKARDDATLKGSIVAEVAKGEVVEAKGANVGDWYPVHIPGATAFIHKDVLAQSDELAALLHSNVASNAAGAARIDKVWGAAQARYTAYQNVLERDLDTAAVLDWSYLSQQLGEVVAHHPDAAVKESAQRMQDGIAKVVRAVKKVQDEHNVTPVRDVPGQPAIAEPTVETVDSGVPLPPSGEASADPVIPVATVPPVTKPADPVKPTATAEIAQAAQTVPKAAPVPPKPVAPSPASLYPAAGYITEQAFPGVGTSYVVIDENQNIQAFIKPKAGSTIQLNDYFWNYVGVKGAKQAVDKSKHNLGKDIPLIEVEDVVILRQ